MLSLLTHHTHRVSHEVRVGRVKVCHRVSHEVGVGRVKVCHRVSHEVRAGRVKVHVNSATTGRALSVCTLSNACTAR